MTPADVINRFYDGESVSILADAAVEDYKFGPWDSDQHMNTALIEMLLRGYMIGLRSATGRDEVES